MRPYFTGPAFLIFPVMVINSVGVIHYVESPFVMVGCCKLNPDETRVEGAWFQL